MSDFTIIKEFERKTVPHPDGGTWILPHRVVRQGGDLIVQWRDGAFMWHDEEDQEGSDAKWCLAQCEEKETHE